MWSKVILALALSAPVRSQQAGKLVVETHPPLTVSSCTTSGCTKQTKSVTVDANWRWLEDSAVNCYTGNLWDQTNCPSSASGATQCAANCNLEGATYEESYGITSKDDSLTLAFITKDTPGTVELTNVGSRTYLMASQTKYEMFKLLNKEFTVTVDVSKLPCGLNGALYFVEMAESGGMSGTTDGFTGNKAGAEFGTGYCDAQCPRDLKFIAGEANVIDWVPSDTDANAGFGFYGNCCDELDIWEANSISQAYTPHTCSNTKQQKCEGPDGTNSCGEGTDEDPEARFAGFCDKNGCDYNPYRYGVTDFYGPGKDFDIDTTKPLTLVTQFITDDATDTGDLVEIKRFFIQNGNLWEMAPVAVPSVETGEWVSYNSITDDFCSDTRAYFNESHNDFKKYGGLKSMGESMARGHVLVMSLWDDHAVNMLWLDSLYPPASPNPHDMRGSCPETSGVPAEVEVSAASASVTFSDVRFGPIGSTFMQQ